MINFFDINRDGRLNLAEKHLACTVFFGDKKRKTTDGKKKSRKGKKVK